MKSECYCPFTYPLYFLTYVTGKPRHNSSNYLGNVNIDNMAAEMTFELISYPAPYKYNVWFAGPLNEAYYAHPHGLVMNVTCTPDQTRRYVARCILNIFNITLQSTGSYKIQVINEVGDENFTLDVTSGELVIFEKHIVMIISRD